MRVTLLQGPGPLALATPGKCSFGLKMPSINAMPADQGIHQLQLQNSKIEGQYHLGHNHGQKPDLHVHQHQAPGHQVHQNVYSALDEERDVHQPPGPYRDPQICQQLQQRHQDAPQPPQDGQQHPDQMKQKLSKQIKSHKFKLITSYHYDHDVTHHKYRQKPEQAPGCRRDGHQPSELQQLRLHQVPGHQDIHSAQINVKIREKYLQARQDTQQPPGRRPHQPPGHNQDVHQPPEPRQAIQQPPGQRQDDHRPQPQPCNLPRPYKEPPPTPCPTLSTYTYKSQLTTYPYHFTSLKPSRFLSESSPVSIDTRLEWDYQIRHLSKNFYIAKYGTKYPDGFVSICLLHSKGKTRNQINIPSRNRTDLISTSPVCNHSINYFKTDLINNSPLQNHSIKYLQTDLISTSPVFNYSIHYFKTDLISTSPVCNYSINHFKTDLISTSPVCNYSIKYLKTNLISTSPVCNQSINYFKNDLHHIVNTQYICTRENCLNSFHTKASCPTKRLPGQNQKKCLMAQWAHSPP